MAPHTHGAHLGPMSPTWEATPSAILGVGVPCYLVAIRPEQGEGRNWAAANVSHTIPVRMLLGSLTVTMTAIAVIGGRVASDGDLHTIRKAYPSGAAANVSHNRPVRMLLGLLVVATAIAAIDGRVVPDGGLHTIRKLYPSGAAAKVSHNRPVRMSQEHGPGWGPGWRPIHHTPWS